MFGILEELNKCHGCLALNSTLHFSHSQPLIPIFNPYYRSSVSPSTLVSFLSAVKSTECKKAGIYDVTHTYAMINYKEFFHKAHRYISNNASFVFHTISYFYVYSSFSLHFFIYSKSDPFAIIYVNID